MQLVLAAMKRAGRVSLTLIWYRYEPVPNPARPRNDKAHVHRRIARPGPGMARRDDRHESVYRHRLVDLPDCPPMEQSIVRGTLSHAPSRADNRDYRPLVEAVLKQRLGTTGPSAHKVVTSSSFDHPSEPQLIDRLFYSPRRSPSPPSCP